MHLQWIFCIQYYESGIFLSNTLFKEQKYQGVNNYIGGSSLCIRISK